MLYINLNEKAKIDGFIYSVNYIDCPGFTFVKRISKCEQKDDIYQESGIDFAKDLFFYTQKYRDNEVSHDVNIYDNKKGESLAKELLREFSSKNIIDIIKKEANDEDTNILLDNLFKEVKLKLEKKC